MFQPTRIALAAVLTVALGVSSSAATEVKVALNGVLDSKVNAEAAFVDGLEDALAGADFAVAVFPSGTIGKEKERFGLVSQGLIDVNLASVNTVFGLSPLVKGVQLPFMYKDGEEFDRVIAESDLLAEMNAPLIANGTIVAWSEVANALQTGSADGYLNPLHFSRARRAETLSPKAKAARMTKGVVSRNDRTTPTAPSASTIPPITNQKTR